MTEKELKDACYHLLAKILANVVKDQFYSAEDNSLVLTSTLSKWRSVATKQHKSLTQSIRGQNSQDNVMTTHYDKKADKEAQETEGK